jgi:hypothetical protein
MAAAGAAHAAAIANATKALGVIVKVEPGEFQAIVKRADSPVIVVARGGVLKKHWEYLTSYKGLAFYTRSEPQLVFSGRYEMIAAKKIWIPA